ncbi:hypothetical protein VD0002_g4899 [Verticillium dahliae]|uniref:Hexosyltransferase n=2 Tax=Verticillium dahliae TaxID=27337 RepID=G2XBS6_VERDV|nr:uncharacterized protein VDAG_07712 [Verticillium dahliae VdLs.17]KAF3349418.1 Phytanoyl-CoA dioxygenase domain-containing protein 1 [Verticillium dahliae VDG2]PNH32847.1 hypothetical protein BJF96_g3918 [Verticillium dahliae]EGY16548.1 hypothetical protein VDAG_07712 [Verticillium dahliae VdLs.17]PNH51354.1 hypothetical protein VD0003_g5900 [Verticillium dahliae]PNH63481.1 hypothetical protein VD0002_g4899 [Verticillium dahliae]
MFSARPCLSLPSAIWTSLTQHIPPRFRRLFTISLLITVGLFTHILLHTRPHSIHHAPYEVPSSIGVVHGNIVEGSPPSLYPLEPFPDSPMIDAVDDDRPPRPWLAVVICAAEEMERRMIIRSSWMRMYGDLPVDTRFVVSNPGPDWTAAVSSENQTFGDMIVLDHLQEDDVTANTVKTLALYQWLIDHNHQYEFVSKMDTDLFFNARGFWDRFLEPRLTNSTGRYVSTVERTVIGELYYSHSWDLAFPHGAMYTMTWDMVELLAGLQRRFHVVTGEDMAVAMLLLKGRERANFVNFRGTEKFDYLDEDARGDGTAWARCATHPEATEHAIVGPAPIAVHQLKDKALWFKVADLFDANGVKPMPPPTVSDPWPSLWMRWHDFWYAVGVKGLWSSRHSRIPDFFWSYEDGSWICDGIWNLGATKTGYVKAAATTMLSWEEESELVGLA